MTNAFFLYKSEQVDKDCYKGPLDRSLREMFYQKSLFSIPKGFISSLYGDNPYFGIYNDLYQIINSIPNNFRIINSGEININHIKEIISTLKNYEDEIKQSLRENHLADPDNYFNIVTVDNGYFDETRQIPKYIKDKDIEESDLFHIIQEQDIRDLDKYFNQKYNIELFNYFIENILRYKRKEWLIIQLSAPTLIINNQTEQFTTLKNRIYYVDIASLNQELILPPTEVVEVMAIERN